MVTQPPTSEPENASGVAAAPSIAHPLHAFGGRDMDLRTEVALMAIVNRTPDSFYDRGRTFALDAAVHAGVEASHGGAEIIDVGGVPFAPGDQISPDEERDRVEPVVREIAAQCEATISVDTFHAAVARACLAVGARIINDTSGLSDPEMARTVADHDAYLVITHSLARPRTVYPKPQYLDVVGEVREFLAQRAGAAMSAGVPPERIIVDPGLDLNKNTLHSLELLRRLPEIASLGFPVLSAPSCKDFIGESVGAKREDRLPGSLTTAVLSAVGGARIIRMHDVAASRQALDMVACTQGWSEPRVLKHNMGDENTPEDIFASRDEVSGENRRAGGA